MDSERSPVTSGTVLFDNPRSSVYAGFGSQRGVGAMTPNSPVKWERLRTFQKAKPYLVGNRSDGAAPYRRPRPLSEVPLIVDSGCRGTAPAAGSGAAQAPGRVTQKRQKEKNRPFGRHPVISHAYSAKGASEIAWDGMTCSARQRKAKHAASQIG